MRLLRQLFALLLLHIIISSKAIELSENSSQSKQHYHRFHKSRSFSSFTNHRKQAHARGIINQGSSLLYGLLTKEDFKLSAGFELSMGSLKIPISIELFFAEAGQMEWTYHPNSEDLKSISKTLGNPEETAKAIVALAENIASSLISTIIMKNAKYLLTTLFPPLTVLLYIHDLIKETGISISKEKGSSEGHEIYKIRYKYELQEDPKLVTFIQLTINATKFLAGLMKFSEWISSNLAFLWSYVPEPIRESLKATLSLVGDITSTILESFKIVINFLKGSLEKLKILAVERIAEGYQWLVIRAIDIWESVKPAASYIAYTIKIFAEENLSPLLKSIWNKCKNVLDAITNFWLNVSSQVGNFICKVGESLMAAGNSVVTFTIDTAKLIWGWMFGFRRYRRFYLHLNRRYLMRRYGRVSRF